MKRYLCAVGKGLLGNLVLGFIVEMVLLRVFHFDYDFISDIIGIAVMYFALDFMMDDIKDEYKVPRWFSFCCCVIIPVLFADIVYYLLVTMMFSEQYFWEYMLQDFIDAFYENDMFFWGTVMTAILNPATKFGYITRLFSGCILLVKGIKNRNKSKGFAGAEAKMVDELMNDSSKESKDD